MSPAEVYHKKRQRDRKLKHNNHLIFTHAFKELEQGSVRLRQLNVIDSI